MMRIIGNVEIYNEKLPLDTVNGRAREKIALYIITRAFEWVVFSIRTRKIWQYDSEKKNLMIPRLVRWHILYRNPPINFNRGGQ